MTEPRNAEFLSEYEEPQLQPKRRWWRRVRDTVTGRFARTDEAEQRPETTVAEKVERKPEPPPWSGVR